MYFETSGCPLYLILQLSILISFHKATWHPIAKVIFLNRHVRICKLAMKLYTGSQKSDDYKTRDKLEWVYVVGVVRTIANRIVYDIQILPFKRYEDLRENML